ncbi:MAG: VOC family protein [Carboxylicivirga sp.]|jgi:catechol 2,3-dioxygenase-like lactoylglutathione lyase family enzyme|nr:VOC family protein [Carboxylicivirga sp.]
MKKNLCGIQQVGIGVKDAQEAWKWYRKVFGMDINVFEDTAVAKLMLPYTKGKECPRYAALAVNMEGGGGYEIWQHTSLEPQAPVFDIELGDTGIYICKMKCRDVHKAFKAHHNMGVDILGSITKTPKGNLHYYVKDPYNNIFEVVEETNHYKKEKSVTGGVFGAVIGVSDIEQSLKVYADILQYDKVIYDESRVFDDLKVLPGGDQKYRRVLLKHKPRTGPFSKLYGPTQIELIQALDRTPQKIYQDRIWGELGYIHLCFDVIGMEKLEQECQEKGFPFTVNSANSFDMGVAAGHFSYISDPDGTPIEFVETHKLPIIESLGWYMNLKGRNPKKSLPNWMINTLKWNRIKN